MVDIGSEISKYASGATDIFLIVVVVVIIGGILTGLMILLMVLKSYKHKVKIRVLTASRKYVVEDSAREVIKDGVTYWKFLKRRDMATAPPPESIELTKKGSFYAECYYTNEGEYVWAKDNLRREQSFDAVTATQRSLLVGRIVQANNRKKRGLLDIISQFTMPLMLLIMVVLILVFWEDIASPSMEIVERADKITASQAIIMEQLARMLTIAASDGAYADLNITQTIQPGGS